MQMQHVRTAAALAAVLLSSSAALAIDPALKVTVLALEGDPIGAVGNLTSIDNVAVNNQADTLVEADTNNADTLIDSVLLKNGVLFLQEGQALAMPAGAAIGSFDAVNLNESGNSGWNFFLDNTSGTTDDSGIYFNTTLLFQEGSFVTAAGVSPGSPYTGFFEAKINNGDDMFVVSSIDDPAVASTTDRLLVRVDPTTSIQTLVALEGQSAPGVAGALFSDFGTGAENFDLNDAGDVMFFADTDLATTIDGVIYVNSTPIAQEGSPSPISGRNWSSLSSPELSINNDGDWVFSASLDGDAATNLLIDKSTRGGIHAQEGDSLPAFSPFLLTSFGSGPVLIADRGEVGDDDPDVLWFADWNADTAIDTGLFLNDKLLLQEGVDMIGGTIIDDVRGIGSGYAMSDDGRYIVVEVNLVGSVDAAVLIDRGPWRSTGGSLGGAGGAPRLRGFGQLTPSTPVTIELTRAVPNSTAALIIGLSRVDLPFMSGTLIPSPDLIIFNLPTDANGSFSVTANWPAAIPSGTKVYLQYWVTDGTAPAGFSASNGIEGTAQ